MQTLKLADLNTSHVSKHDATLIGRWAQEASGALPGCPVPLVVYAKGEYGWFIYLPQSTHVQDVLNSMADSGATPEFMELVRALSARSVSLLCLDCDGEVDNKITRFEW